MKSMFFFGATDNFCEIVKNFTGDFVFNLMIKPDMKNLNFTLSESEVKNFQSLIENGQNGYILNQIFSVQVSQLKVKYEISISYINQSELNVRLNIGDEQEFMNVKLGEKFKSEILKIS